VRKNHYYLNTKLAGVSRYREIESSTYRELSRGFVSGIERLEKIELLGEK
jgi:hypothetical protein